MKVWASRSRAAWLWLVMAAGACLVVAQYQWLVPQAQPPPPPLPSGLQAAVDSLQLDAAVVEAVGERVLRDIALQLSQRLISDNCGGAGTAVDATGIGNGVSGDIGVGNSGAGAGASERRPRSPPLYVVTPTYRRPEQVPELTRLAQTLMHVPNLHWLVIEDSHDRTPQVTQLLRRTGLSFDHLVAPMPESYKKKKGSKPRGVSNRNRGIEWLRANATTGVLYFADDDNTYDIALFEEMRDTRRVSMWPVGLCTKFGLSSPIVRNGTFSGFYDGWIAGRKFPVDMAGFAVSVEFLLQRPKATMPYKPGFEEDGFLRSLAPFEAKDVELKADNCTKIFVWHTQTKKNEPAVQLDFKKYNNTNLVHLRSLIV